MEWISDTSQLKVGGICGYARIHMSHLSQSGISTVAKISAIGQVTLADGHRFNKRGKEMSVEYGGLALCSADSLRKRIEYENAERERYQRFRQFKELVEQNLRYASEPLSEPKRSEIIAAAKSL